jgi:hypothetical protein
MEVSEQAEKDTYYSAARMVAAAAPMLQNTNFPLFCKNGSRFLPHLN